MVALARKEMENMSAHVQLDSKDLPAKVYFIFRFLSLKEIPGLVGLFVCFQFVLSGLVRISSN